MKVVVNKIVELFFGFLAFLCFVLGAPILVMGVMEIIGSVEGYDFNQDARVHIENLLNLIVNHVVYAVPLTIGLIYFKISSISKKSKKNEKNIKKVGEWVKK